jgi:hypothetical protein
MIFRVDDLELLVERKTAGELYAIASDIVRGNSPAGIYVPPSNEDRRDKDNSPWILWRWLPGNWANLHGKRGRNVGADLWKRNPSAMIALLESYTARVFDGEAETDWSYEQHCCDGSTGVPDDQMPCDVWCKDPASVLHDYLFDLHHAGEADATGKVWTLEEANEAYRDVLLSDGWNIRAHIRFFGLQLFAGRWW